VCLWIDLANRDMEGGADAMKAGAELFNALDRHPGYQLGHLVSTFRIRNWNAKEKLPKTRGFLQFLTMVCRVEWCPKMAQCDAAISCRGSSAQRDCRVATLLAMTA
jgi:N-acetyl-gamma-glutamylphosphate reductase